MGEVEDCSLSRKKVPSEQSLSCVACGRGRGNRYTRTLLNAVLVVVSTSAGDAGDALIVVVLGGSALLGVAALCRQEPPSVHHVPSRVGLRNK